jgi:hypothetical protein
MKIIIDQFYGQSHKKEILMPPVNKIENQFKPDRKSSAVAPSYGRN